MHSPLSVQHLVVSWEDLHRQAKALARQLRGTGSWQGIVAVARGGLVPAAIVAHQLDIRNIETVSAIGYKKDTAREESVDIIKHAVAAGDGEGWLVIEDMIDTGRTVQLLRTLMPKAHVAALYVKPQGRPLADSFMVETSQNTWVFFPWENDRAAEAALAERETSA